ncbi:MAG: hypothetical protein AB7K86_03370 [Rhodospirillales bacterium]
MKTFGLPAEVTTTFSLRLASSFPASESSAPRSRAGPSGLLTGKLMPKEPPDRGDLLLGVAIDIRAVNGTDHAEPAGARHRQRERGRVVRTERALKDRQPDVEQIADGRV